MLGLQQSRKGVFNCTAEMLLNIPFHCVNKFGLFPISGNTLFKIDNRVISHALLEQNFLQVYDFIDTNTFTFYSFDDVKTKTGLNLNFLQFQSIKNAITQGARHLNFNISLSEKHQRPTQPLLHNIISFRSKGCKPFYNILISKQIVHHNSSDLEMKWHNELGNLIGIETWANYRKICTGISFFNKMKWLQFRILHRILPVNRLLCKFVPNIRNICDFCLNGEETITHFFYRCPNIQIFITETTQFMNSIGIDITIDEKKMIFGNANLEPMSFFNLIVLFMKNFIWFCKQKKILPTVETFKNYIKPILETLKMIYTIKNDELYFTQSWGILHDSLFQLRDDGAYLHPR